MRAKGIFKKLNVCISLCLVVMLHVGVVTAQNTSPLCFTARNGSVTVRFYIGNVTHAIQYSTDGSTWNTYTSNTNVTISANQSIYFRAASNQTYATAFCGSNAISQFYFNGGLVEGSGNIMSLYGPDCPDLPLQYRAFQQIFSSCTLLTTAPSLPATTLAEECYSHMFQGCTSLVTAPVLPATTMVDNCYFNMFERCTSLITPPALPATTLAHQCYYLMFNECTALAKAPALPATTLAYKCYAYMFEGCTALTTPPSLPATTLADYCYLGMFKECTALTIPPSLPATTLADYCYSSMFLGCTSITTVPSLPATTLTQYCYSAMFNGCSSLRVNTSSPGKQWKIQVTSTAYQALSSMFANTGGTMNGAPSVNTTYYIASAPQHNVAVSANDQARGTISGGGSYYFEDIATLTAHANTHYHFVYWSDGNTNNPRNITVSGDTAFTAVFGIDEHTITGAGANGTVTGGGTYDYGSTATLTATANLHYHFARWSDGNTQNPRTVTVSGDATYTAVFEGDPHTITAGGTNGIVTGGGTYNYGTTATLTAIADDHYHFVRWSDGNTQNPRTVTVSGNATYTTVFEIDKHTIALAGNNGSFTGNGTYDYGTTVTLTVTPDEHFYFSRWSDGNTDNPRNVVVTADVTYTAIMEGELHTVAATCEHGVVNGSGTYHYSDIVTLAVLTDNGYKFVEWSDGEVYNPRVFVVEGDLEVEAICEAVTGVEDVKESVAFYYVRGRVVNPEGVMLRMYSTEGKMVKIGDGDIMMEGLPAGMYMVVDERGRSLKVVVKP